MKTHHHWNAYGGILWENGEPWAGRVKIHFTAPKGWECALWAHRDDVETEIVREGDSRYLNLLMETWARPLFDDIYHYIKSIGWSECHRSR